MRIVFIGTVEFSHKILEKIINIDGNVVGVCTKEESNFNNDFKDLAPLCKENLIPIKYVDNINSKENIKWISDKNPDIIFCFGWSSLIKSELLNIAPMGIIGFHPALLPRNRGRHPIIWALALGLEKTGSTFFFMDEGADSGDILSQEEIDINFEDNAGALYTQITKVALMQVEVFLPQLQNNTYIKTIQNHSESNYWRKRSKKDGEIDFRMSSEAIYNLVRALAKPYVGAHLVYNKEDIKVWEVKVISCDKQNIESGKVLDIYNNRILIKTYDGAIELLEHEFNKLPRIGEDL